VSFYLVAAGLGAAQLLGNPLGAVAAGRWGRYFVITGSLVVISVATVLVGIVPGVILAFTMVLAAGFFTMFFFPPMLAYIPELVRKPEQVGAATGMNTLLGFAGSMVAPWIFGLLLDAGSGSRGAYLWGFLMLAAFGVAAIIGMLFFGATRKRAR